MSGRVAILGAGAVSPAGWSAGELATAVLEDREIPPEDRESGGFLESVRVRSRRSGGRLRPQSVTVSVVQSLVATRQ